MPITKLELSDPPNTNPWRLIAQIAVAFFIAGMFFATFFSTRRPDVQDQDFGAYYRAGQAVAAGVSPYTIDSHGPLGAYMYAPVFAHFAFRYFAALPYLWAVRLFLLINWIATVACVWLCLRLIRSPNRDLFWLGLIALVPTGDYLKANLHNGQVGTLLLLACLIWLNLMLSGRCFLGGLVLSLAVGLKLYPALLVPYLLLRKDWRGIAGVTIGILILFAAPAAFVGWHRVIPLHTEWLRFCVSTQITDQTTRSGNQSLLAVLARLPFITDGKQRLVSAANLANLLKIYPLIVVAITGVIYAGLYLSNRKSPKPVFDVALLLLWMTIAAPRAWTFNFAAEILAAFLLADVVVARREHFRLAAAALASVAIALAFPTNSFTYSSRWGLTAYLLQNKHFDALVFLGAVVIAVCHVGVFTVPEHERDTHPT